MNKVGIITILSIKSIHIPSGYSIYILVGVLTVVVGITLALIMIIWGLMLISSM